MSHEPEVNHTAGPGYKANCLKYEAKGQRTPRLGSNKRDSSPETGHLGLQPKSEIS